MVEEEAQIFLKTKSARRLAEGCTRSRQSPSNQAPKHHGINPLCLFCWEGLVFWQGGAIFHCMKIQQRAAKKRHVDQQDKKASPQFDMTLYNFTMLKELQIVKDDVMHAKFKRLGQSSPLLLQVRVT